LVAQGGIRSQYLAFFDIQLSAAESGSLEGMTLRLPCRVGAAEPKFTYTKFV
jgi:hypothetical protein